MTTCDACGNDYHQPMEIKKNDKIYKFDCFECAIHILAPNCKHCNCKIIGHGIESDDSFYCCAHCARKDGITLAKDHV